MQLYYKRQPTWLQRYVWPVALCLAVVSVIGFATPSLEDREAYLGVIEKEVTQLMDDHHRISADTAWDEVKNETAYFYWLEALDREVQNVGDAFYLAEIANANNWEVRKNRLEKTVNRAETLVDKVKAQMFNE